MPFPREREFLLFNLEPKERSWQGLLLLISVFFGAIILAMILSPMVYAAVQIWSERAPNVFNVYLAEKDFVRYFDRVRWIAVFLSLPWLFSKCGLWSWRGLGLELGAGALPAFLFWAVVGVCSLTLVAVTQSIFAEVTLTGGGTGELANVILKGLTAALLLGLLEETIFRGMVLRMFYSAFRPWAAVVMSAVFFSLVHFKKVPPDVWVAEPPIGIEDGIAVGLWTISSVVHTFDPVIFINLALVGGVLGILFLMTRSLWPCIGLHAGWVFFVGVYSDAFTVLTTGAGEWVWGSARCVDGVATGVSLLMMLTLILVFWRARWHGTV